MTKKLSEQQIRIGIDSIPGCIIDTSADPIRLKSEYRFKNFSQALAFTNHAGSIAEEMDHHPEILLSWGMVQITIFTHSEGGITDMDLEFMKRVATETGAQ